MTHVRLHLGIVLLVAAAGNLIAADAPTSTPNLPNLPHRLIGKQDWHTDYLNAYRQAKREHKQLLLYFYDHTASRVTESYESSVLTAAELQKPLAGFVRVMLPLNASIPSGSKSDDADPEVGAGRPLLDFEAFHHMHGQPGLAVIDLVNEEDHLFGRVVSAHPFREGRHYTAWTTGIVLGLPRATLSQRTLVYAVRVHPEAPRSTVGVAHSYMMEQAEHHSQLMAQYQSVGHHDWGTRSGMIGSKVGYSPVEAASVSSSTNDIVQAAKECVALWRSSGAHWVMVVAPCGSYGYDMVRAPNGAWYATGIFAGPAPQ